MNSNDLKALSRLKILLLDFDGVLTDNRVLIDENGKESVFVNRSDGLAVNEFCMAGIMVAIVSTEKNDVVLRRAEKLKIKAFYGINNKKDFIVDLCTKLDTPLQMVAFIGNDLNDLEAMEVVSLSSCPADACAEVLKTARYVLHTRGGYGVVREFLALYREATHETST